MPSFGILLIFNANTYIAEYNSTFKLIVLLITFISTFALPLLSTLLLLKGGFVKDLQLSDREERKHPLLFTALFYTMGVYLMNFLLPLPPLIGIMLWGVAASVVLTLIINLFWKISAHMIGVGGITGAIIGLSYQLGADLLWIIMLLFLIAGCLGFSRLKLSAHQPAQVYSGFLLGMFCQVILLLR